MAGSRSRIVLYTVAAFISLAGLTDATYLTVQSVTGETLVCGGSADCFRVLGSVYARIAGIPVAAFGVVGYFGAFSLATGLTSNTRALAWKKSGTSRSTWPVSASM